MKYRVKIITFKNGRKEYVPQVKKLFFWLNINRMGEATIYSHGVCDDKLQAFKSIENHAHGNTTILTFDLEYFK